MVECSECNKKFESKNALNGHMRMHGPSGGTMNENKVYIEKIDKYVRPTNEMSVRKAIKKCPECKEFHRNPKFCSQSCSASYNNKKRKRSEETNEKISRSMEKYFKENTIENLENPQNLRKSRRSTKIHFITCKNCETLFVDSFNKGESKHLGNTCSSQCARVKTYKETEKQKYNGVYLHSSWELAFAKYLDKNNMNWKRPKNGFEYSFENKNRLYYPDFYLPQKEIYIEIKGYKTKKDESKWSHFPKNMKVLRRQDLEELGLLE